MEMQRHDPVHSGQPMPPHRFTQGTFDVTVFSDGYLTLTADILLPDAGEAEQSEMIGRLGGTQRGAPIRANIPLLRRGDELILFDTGAGGNFQPSTGRLAENLRAAGIHPDEITAVIYTHAHPDHSGGTTTAGGSLLFPNARYFLSRAEWEFWTDGAFEERNRPDLHAFGKGAKRDLFAVEDRLSLIEPDDEVLPGIVAIATPGHTPGHLSYRLDGTDPLLITGDACTSDVIFFEHPDWHFGFDTDPERALKTRKELLDRAARETLLMLGYHWAYPGLGYAERNGNAYRFIQKQE